MAYRIPNTFDVPPPGGFGRAVPGAVLLHEHRYGPCSPTVNRSLNPMRVHPQEDLAELYRGHDAFLFTSRYEAWGMPVMEAMASGLAVVATRCLGVATFAQHAQNCLLADPQVRCCRADAMADAMARVFH